MARLFVIILFATLFNATIHASEPAYCSPEKFAKLEVPSPLTGAVNNGLIRMRSFKVGATTLVGVAVGDSKTPSTQKLATTFSGPDVAQDRYCTWYFATSNKTALKSFISHPIQNPFSISGNEAAQVFMSAIESSFFDDGDLSFIGCAQKQHYIAMGCTEQRHRGPTVFAMMLAFSGCTPEHAFAIVDAAWGLNGLNPIVRMNAIKAAYIFGNQNPSKRDEFSQLLR